MRGRREQKQEVMERIRERQHRGKCIASIYKPEREALDWVMENKTERGSQKRFLKNRQMGEKMKRWMDAKKSWSCQ